MPPEAQAQLLEMYQEVLTKAYGLEKSIDRAVEAFDIEHYPRERAFVSTIRQSLGELATVARIASEDRAAVHFS